MATPRKRWFRVADSVAHEPWSNDVLATLVRLSAHMHTRWARDGRSATEACTIVLRRAELASCTGRAQFARALRTIRECAAHVTLTVREVSGGVEIVWPKWSEFQGLTARESPESRPGVPPETPPPRPSPSSLVPRPEQSPPASPPETAAADPPPRTHGDPERWATLLSREPGTHAEHVAFVADVLPQIEAEAEARGHEPMTREWTARVKERLWAFWRKRAAAPRSAATIRRESYAEREERARQEAFEAGVAALEAIRREREHKRAERALLDARSVN